MRQGWDERWRSGTRWARRMPAVANALKGMGRAAAARAAGMNRQAVRDAAAPRDWTASMTGRRRAARRRCCRRAPSVAPIPKTDGVRSWTLPDLCRGIEDRFDKRLPGSVPGGGA